MLESIFCARSRISPASRWRRAVSITCRSTRRWRVSRIPREPSSRCRRPGASWTLIRSPVETRCAGVAAMFAKLQLYPNADSQPCKTHRAALLRAAAIQCGLNHSVTHRFTHLSFTWRGDGRLFVERAFARHRGDDLPAVKTPILDKNFAGLHSADHDTGDIDSGHITFETFRIRLRLPGYRIEANSLPLEKFEVRMIAGHRENLNGG